MNTTPCCKDCKHKIAFGSTMSSSGVGVAEICINSNCKCHTTHSQEKSWEEEFDKLSVFDDMPINPPSWVKPFIQDLLSKAREETAKAFGGCTYCYGKGYATVKDFTIGAEDFGNDGFGPIKNNPIRPCERCDRGTQIQTLLTTLKDIK